MFDGLFGKLQVFSLKFVAHLFLLVPFVVIYRVSHVRSHHAWSFVLDIAHNLRKLLEAGGDLVTGEFFGFNLPSLSNPELFFGEDAGIIPSWFRVPGVDRGLVQELYDYYDEGYRQMFAMVSGYFSSMDVAPI